MGAFFLFVALLSLAGHALFYAWAKRTVPWVARHPRGFAAVVAVVAMCVPLSRLFAHGLVPFFSIEALALLIGGFLSVLFTTIALGGVRIAAWLRGVKPAVEASAKVETSIDPATETMKTETVKTETVTKEEPEAISRRVMIERGVGVLTYGVVGSVLGWGVVRGRHDYQIEEVVVRIPGLSPKLDGYTIAQVSDLHAGMLVDAAEFDRGFAFVRAAKPDLVVATGDLIDHDAAFAPMLARKLAELGARDGTVAILGNHDYYAGAKRVEQAMRDAGVNLLINEGHLVQRDAGPGLLIAGLDDYAGYRYGRGPDLEGLLRRLEPAVREEAPRVVLAHQPPFFDELYGRAALQLSGHTHGGQINLGVPSAKLVGMRYVAGRYGGPSSTLWVNRGFGVAGPPARVGAPPEITKIVLVAG